MDTSEILKGVHLHIIPTKKFKTTGLSILIRQPLKKETATINAIIPLILERGCAKYDTLAKINAKTESLFGSIFEMQIVKKGEFQLIQFFMEFVNQQNSSGSADLTCNCLKFIKEMMLNPLVEQNGFKQTVVESEKENLRFAIESRMNNKGEYAKLRCLEEMCKGEPFGIYGDGFVEDLDGLTPKNIYAHYKQMLETSPIDFVVIGDVDVNALKSEIEALFVFKRGEVLDVPQADFCHEVKTVKTIEENMNLVQGKICVGFRSGVNPVSDDFYTLMLANEIFGGGANSKLFARIREKESLCYYVHATVYRFKGLVLVQSGVEAEHFQTVLVLIQDALEQMQEGQIDEAEIDSAKKSLAKKFQGAKDFPAATMDFYLSQHMLNDPDTLDDVVLKLNKIKKEHIQQMAQKITMDTIYLLR